MKRTVKQLAMSGIRWAVGITARTPSGRYILEQAANTLGERIRAIQHGQTHLKFVAANSLNDFRIATFSSKEPETLEWIDAIPPGSVIWDIGANIGLYSCYAAKARRCRVFAFEPSVFNLELLARNVFLNDLTDRVTIVPLALSDRCAVNKLNMSTMERGGALSTFGERYGHDGRPLHKAFEFATIGITMSDAVSSLGIPEPQYIKIDVDGIEHLILQGGMPVLQQVTGVLVEINDEFIEQSRGSAQCLEAAGLRLRDKSHSRMVEESEFHLAYNQIWRRTTGAEQEV